MANGTESFTARDDAAIRAMVDTHLRSILAHDPDAFLATCTDDIIFMPPEQPPVVGKEGCRGFLKDFPVPEAFTSEIADVEGTGDLAFARGSATASFPDGATVTFTYVGIHRRQPDGSWKMARDIWNTDDASPR